MISSHTIKHVQHIRRRNRNKGIIAAIVAIGALEQEFIGIDTPEMKAHRIAVEGPMAYIENSPELYGQSLAETVRKYYKGGSFVAGKDDCDQELSENDKAIVGATLHLGDVEKPA